MDPTMLGLCLLRFKFFDTILFCECNEHRQNNGYVGQKSICGPTVDKDRIHRGALLQHSFYHKAIMFILDKKKSEGDPGHIIVCEMKQCDGCILKSCALWTYSLAH